ncbi:hypothetical protein [Mycobacterium phage WXIN]|nr:hypothetical protein [Mycobacterium phage WXIN]
MNRIALAALVALSLAGCGAPRPPTEYQRYTDACHDRGGFVSQHSRWNTFEYECLGQTTGPPLPAMTR